EAGMKGRLGEETALPPLRDEVLNAAWAWHSGLFARAEDATRCVDTPHPRRLDARPDRRLVGLRIRGRVQASIQPLGVRTASDVPTTRARDLNARQRIANAW